MVVHVQYMCVQHVESMCTFQPIGPVQPLLLELLGKVPNYLYSVGVITAHFYHCTASFPPPPPPLSLSGSHKCAFLYHKECNYIDVSWYFHPVTYMCIHMWICTSMYNKFITLCMCIYMYVL